MSIALSVTINPFKLKLETPTVLRPLENPQLEKSAASPIITSTRKTYYVDATKKNGVAALSPMEFCGVRTYLSDN